MQPRHHLLLRDAALLQLAHDLPDARAAHALLLGRQVLRRRERAAEVRRTRILVLRHRVAATFSAPQRTKPAAVPGHRRPGPSRDKPSRGRIERHFPTPSKPPAAAQSALALPPDVSILSAWTSSGAEKPRISKCGNLKLHNRRQGVFHFFLVSGCQARGHRGPRRRRDGGAGAGPGRGSGEPGERVRSHAAAPSRSAEPAAPRHATAPRDGATPMHTQTYCIWQAVPSSSPAPPPPAGPPCSSFGR